VIRGHLELLGEDPEERRETLALVDDELDRMSRLVEDLLTLAKAERTDFLRYEEVDLDLFTEELLAKAEKLAPRDWSVAALGTGRITADRQRLTQAVMNLAANAAQHTRPGDPIALGSALRNGGAEFWVRDRGPGIAPADQDRIFERFVPRGRRAPATPTAPASAWRSSTRSPRPTGATSARVAPGRGATFTVRRPDPPTRGAHGMNRILIAEDEARVAAFVEKGLRANGYTTTAVGDGPTAVALARDDDFDLLVLDLGLPGLDGLSVLRTLRGQGHRLPVLILSARDDVADKVAGLELGADDYLTKPFRFEELLARVRVRLRGEGTREQTVLRVGGVTLDLRTRRATVDERQVELSAREFAMLEVFLRHHDQVLSREQLLSHVWGYQHDPESNVVDVYVGYLRRKVGRERIATVRGMGYALHA
jgi:DNA-binding response OmpR family regulator